VGDVDKAPNGLPDLVVGNDNQPNRLYLNTGGAFAAGTNISADINHTTSVALGDVNGDGWLDLVVGNDHVTNGQPDQPNLLYLNNGSGAFLPGTVIDSTAHRTVAVALADVDNDGRVDLVVANRGEPSLLYVNTGSSLATTPGTVADDAFDT